MRWSRSARARPRAFPWLTERPYAHRGLHGSSAIENSRAAFRAAIEAGLGIELDVQASRCGTPFVFHDTDLARLCGVDGEVSALARHQLASTRLGDGGETIPTLAEVLALIDGRVPLLVELKARRFSPILCRAVARLLRNHAGPAAVMSFNPRIPRWFAAHAPAVPRGLVISEEPRDSRSLIANRLAFRFARADFAAYDIRSLPAPFAASLRARGIPLLSWTVRSAGERERASMFADQIVFERS